MGMNPLGQTPSLRRILQRFPDARAMHWLADARETDHTKERVAARYAELLAAQGPFPDYARGLRIDPDDPPAIALPVKDGDRAGAQVYVFGVERERLRDSQAEIGRA